MNYIVFDLEWNQSPNGKEFEEKGLPFEIFEIGAVKLNEKREYVDKFSCLIKPQVYKELHYVAKELTHISMERLETGKLFDEAVMDFIRWCEIDGDFIFCTWGSMDILELQRNMRYFNVKADFGYPLLFYDVQKLFSIDREEGELRRSLENAVDMLEVDKMIDFHSALNDAIYTAQVFEKLDFNKVCRYTSIDTYYIPKTNKQEIVVDYGTYEKYITKGYKTKEEVLSSRKLLTTKCYICQNAARKKIKWFTVNSKMHYCLAVCKEHGFIKGKFRVKEDEFGNYYAIRILKRTDNEGAALIKERQLEMRRKRQEKRKKMKA